MSQWRPVLKVVGLTIGLTLYGSGIALGTQSGRDSEGSLVLMVTGAGIIAGGLTL